jgi:hypothetical protein
MFASLVTLGGKQARHRGNRKEENAPATDRPTIVNRHNGSVRDH